MRRTSSATLSASRSNASFGLPISSLVWMVGTAERAKAGLAARATRPGVPSRAPPVLGLLARAAGAGFRLGDLVASARAIAVVLQLLDPLVTSVRSSSTARPRASTRRRRSLGPQSWRCGYL